MTKLLSMNILMITDNLRGGGAERRMIETIRGLLALGYSISLVSLNTINAYPEIDNLGITIYRIKRKIKKDPFVIIRLFQIAIRCKPSLIHTWGTMSSVYAVTLKVILRIKLVNAMVTNARCLRYSRRWWRARLTFPFSDLVLSNSHAGLLAYSAPPGKSMVIYNGFDFSRTRNLEPADAVRMRYSLPPGLIVGMVGFIDHRKDHATLIEAAKMISGSGSKVVWLCVGDGPLLDEMREKSSHMKDFIFLGRQSGIESLIQLFDIGVLTTHAENHAEGISNSILEYMALEKPVVASSGGGTDEIIQDGETGYLVPSGDPEQLASKISLLLNNEELRKHMGAKGKERIQTRFGFDTMIRKTHEVYQKLNRKT